MILVAGSANLDFVVRAPHIPSPGETVLGRDFKTFPGGKGANQAVACARAGGAPTHMLLALGNDAFAAPIEASLSEAQVQLHLVRVPQHPTGTAFICVSDEAENAITVAPGANEHLQVSDLPPLTGFTHLLLQLETPLATVTAYAQAAKAQGVTVVLNAAPAQTLPAELLDGVDVLVVNQGELATVSGHNGSIAEALQCITTPTVVVTLGHHGCVARRQSHWVLQPAFKVTPVDTTAAGDTFCGTLVAALAQGADMAQALRQASAAGALACTQLGAQSSIPHAADVADFLASQAREPSSSELEALRNFCGLG
ncbi:MAG: ribokinase [Rhodoferax sp.]|nr:ribokinase [Rhodoferax sp.]MBP7491468.1 ribokinase [Rhodoferax sp.]